MIKPARFSLSFIFLLALQPLNIALADNETLLSNTIHGEQRSEQNKSRDRARHPAETLTFFDVKPNSTVLEIWPGKGWYSEILAPYIKQGGGQFIAAGFPLSGGPAWRKKVQLAYNAKLTAQPAFYDHVSVVELGTPSSWNLGEDSSVDNVLTFRNVHNWLKGGYEKHMFDAFYKVLKPGGTLGIVEHRAKAGTDLETMKASGYVTEQLVIELAEKAGFVLVQRSEINANPKDSKDYPKGVWTLPPTLRLGDENKARYLAIGESDRMTLKFKK